MIKNNLKFILKDNGLEQVFSNILVHLALKEIKYNFAEFMAELKRQSTRSKNKAPVELYIKAIEVINENNKVVRPSKEKYLEGLREASWEYKRKLNKYYEDLRVYCKHIENENINFKTVSLPSTPLALGNHLKELRIASKRKKKDFLYANITYSVIQKIENGSHNNLNDVLLYFKLLKSNI